MDKITQLNIMVEKVEDAISSIEEACEATPDQYTLVFSDLKSILGTLKEKQMYLQKKLIKAYKNRDEKERTCKTCKNLIDVGAPFRQCMKNFKFTSEDDTCDKWEER